MISYIAEVQARASDSPVQAARARGITVSLQNEIRRSRRRAREVGAPLFSSAKTYQSTWPKKCTTRRNTLVEAHPCEEKRKDGGTRTRTNRGYSELPRCSLLVGVILPNIPSFSSLGPAVKNSSVARPLLVLSPPKLSAHSPSIQSG